MKNCQTCEYWKTYRKLENTNKCACEGLSSGCFPGNQLYTSPSDFCLAFVKKIPLHFYKFRKEIKIKK